MTDDHEVTDEARAEIAAKLARLATPTSNGANRKLRCWWSGCDRDGEGVRQYLNVDACDEHSPWAMAGRSRIEPPPRAPKVRPHVEPQMDPRRQREIGKKARGAVDSVGRGRGRR